VWSKSSCCQITCLHDFSSTTISIGFLCFIYAFYFLFSCTIIQRDFHIRRYSCRLTAIFWTNHRTTDSLFILKILITKYLFKKKRKICAWFADLRKAFDTVWHSGFQYKLMKPKWFISSLIQILFSLLVKFFTSVIPLCKLDL
jgi:hypothetical protein